MSTKKVSKTATTGQKATLAWSTPSNVKITTNWQKDGAQSMVSPNASDGSAKTGTVNISVTRGADANSQATVDFDGQPPTCVSSKDEKSWMFTAVINNVATGTSVYTLKSDAPGADDWIETLVVTGSGLEDYPDYMALTDSQKKPLADWVTKGSGSGKGMGTTSARLSDAKDLATLMKKGGSAVADAFAQEITKKPQIVPRMTDVASIDWFTSTNGDTQCQLVRLYALLCRYWVGSKADAATVLDNTLSRFAQGVKLVMVGKTDGKEVLAQYNKASNTVQVAVGGALGVTASGISNEPETVRKLCHEVNHSCRKDLDTDAGNWQLYDEFYAYTTELVAVGEVVSRQQTDNTLNKILPASPYFLGAALKNDAGQAFIKAFVYTEYQGDNDSLHLDSVPKPSGNAGWNFTNA